MKIDVNQTLEQLAQAFNTTVDKLYPILIKQAIVTGITHLIILFMVIAITVIVYLIALKQKKKFESLKGEYTWRWTEEGFPYFMILLTLSVVLFFGSIITLREVPTALMNPEYWALKEVIETISGN